MRRMILIGFLCLPILVSAQSQSRNDSIKKAIKALEDTLDLYWDDDVIYESPYMTQAQKELDSLYYIIYSQTWKAKHNCDFSSLELMVSSKFYDHGFYTQLPYVGSINPGKNFNYIGLEAVSIYNVNREFSGPGALSVSHMLPENIVINDSIKAKLSAFNVGISLLGVDIIRKNKYFEFFGIVGANIGRMRIYGNERVCAKNPFFSPKLTLMPRVAIWRFVFSCSAEYEWDISSTLWKPIIFGPKPDMYIQPFRQSGLTLALKLGFNFE